MEEQILQSIKQRFPERYGNLEGEALSRAVHRDFYGPGAVGFEDRNGNQQGGISDGDPGWTYPDFMEAVANQNPEDPQKRSRMSDYVISALVGGGLGFMMGGPVGAAVGAGSEASCTTG